MPRRQNRTCDGSGFVAAEGRADAFTTLFERHHGAVFHYAYRLCLSRTEAEDVAQETFIKVARGIRYYRPESPFMHWLFRICTNTARNALRRHSRRVTFEVLAPEHEAAAEVPCDLRQQQLEEALLSLSAEVRAAVVLVFYEGMNHAEAASILGCAETTVSWRIFRAKRQLKHFLTRHE